MNRKVKIVYLVTESEWAGASRYVYDLATHLPHEKFEITVAAAGKGDVLTALLRKHGIKTIHLRWLPRTIHPIKDFLAFWEILFLYFRERPNIIHLNSSKAGFIGSLAAALYKLLKAKSYQLKAIVFTAHGWVFNEPGRANWFFRGLERFASYFRDHIICVSENDRQEALRLRIAPAGKLVTIHNGIDVGSMRFLDRETACRKLKNQELRIRNYEIGTNPRLIGCIANLYPNKGLEYLFKALSLLKRKTLIPNSKFQIHTIIIGDGPLRPALEAQIKKYGLEDRVFLVGQIPEAWQYLKAFDCFVLPSIKEGLPYAILEALAAGIPVVATNVGGIPEIARETSLHLVPPQDPKALADALLEMLEKETSNQPSFPSEFMLETMVERNHQVYRGVASLRG